MKQGKELVKKLFRLFGLEVTRFRKIPSHLLTHRIDLLLDVGANVGQYCLRARAEGYRNRMVSFEPLSSAYRILTNVAKSDDLWVVHERCAIGSKTAEKEINVALNSHSSSLLPMLPIHSSAAPDSIFVGKEPTRVIPLDSVFDDYRRGNERVFLKIDTQGYEKEVLDGAINSLKHIVGVQLELSLMPLYESQQLYDYFFQYLKDSGFDLWSLISGFRDRRTGQILQFDAIFIRT